MLAAELVTAAVKGDTKTAMEKEKQWYRNADDIAVFLSSINPYLGNRRGTENVLHAFSVNEIRSGLYD